MDTIEILCDKILYLVENSTNRFLVIGHHFIPS